MAKQHQKHAKLARPAGGDWGRAELALLGAPCSIIAAFVREIIDRCSPKW
jgi:hypothetical protein